MYYPHQITIAEIMTETPQIDISVYMSVDSAITLVTIFNNEETNAELLQKYGFMIFPYYDNLEETTLNNAVEKFVESWDRFMSKNKISFGRIWETYVAEYKPLNNYDMTETESSDETRGKTEKIFTPSSDNITSTSTTTRDNVDTLVTTFDDQTARLDTSVENPTTTINTTTNTVGNTETSEQKTPNKMSRTLSRSGNIGVTTSQQMIQSELDLRKFDFVNYVLTEFVKQNLFFVGD